MTQLSHRIPIHLRRGGPLQRRAASAADSGAELLEAMRERLGLASYERTSILDIGCGIRVTGAIVDKEIPVRRYVGMDVESEVIEFLRANVEDPRLEFHHLNLHNRCYNPAGELLTPEYRLPVSEKFDVICLF